MTLIQIQEKWHVSKILFCSSHSERGRPWWLSGKEPACNAGDVGSVPGLGRSPGGGNGCPPQYSCLEDSMDRGAWWATVHGVTNSQTRPKWLNTYKHTNARTVRESGRFYNCFNEEVKTHHVQGIKEMLKWIIKESYFFFPAVEERGGKLDLSQTGWNVRNYQLSVAPTAVKQLRVRKKKKSESNKAEIACYG